ncbi:MAG TPA: PepSY-associated TM helix domain-containing protein [Planctomycetota bacterium]|nr:PepSY-associated TM helix domain-containing protein [Planctomycetota bacterium]
MSTTRSRAPKLNRKLHRLGAVVAAAPLLVVILSGLLLQVKKQWSFVQPPTARGAAPELLVDWGTILEAAQSVGEAGVASWDDVDRIDVRPAGGMLKLLAHSGWELQIDTGTGMVLSSSYRRSDLIEAIHDGSFFGGNLIKLWVFLPAALILLGLWVSGVYLWLLPYLVKRRRKTRG